MIAGHHTMMSVGSRLPYPYYGTDKFLFCLNGFYNKGVNAEHADTASTWVDLAKGATLSQVGSSTPFSFTDGKCHFTTTKRALYGYLDFSGISAFSFAGTCDSEPSWGIFSQIRLARSTVETDEVLEFFPNADYTGTCLSIWGRFISYADDAPKLHVALTYDGDTTVKFYVNGSLSQQGSVASDTLSRISRCTYVCVGGDAANNSDLGRYPPAGSSMYDFSCWGACLTDSEVAKLCHDTKKFYGIL